MTFSIFKIFFKGSKTYFTTSLFFPPKVRDDVFTLYAFVRTADDFIDQTAQDTKAFEKFYSEYKKSLEGKHSNLEIVNNFVALMKIHTIKKEWVESFFEAMRADTKKSTYNTLEETIDYMYGSAEVIGLMMARILGLPEKSYPYAQMLGRSMQYANFIRDIDEDNQLDRQYIPTELLKNKGMVNLKKPETTEEIKKFNSLIQEEINRVDKWQAEAEKGFIFIPVRSLIPIKTASDMYVWTIKKIKENPCIIFDKKVKPSRGLIIWVLLKNTLSLSLSYQLNKRK